MWRQSGMEATRTRTMEATAEGGKDALEDNVKLFRIRLLGHCIFCLRKTSRSKDALRTLPRNCATIEELEEVPNSDLDMLAFSGNLVTTFNRLWPYLQGGKKEGNDEDPLSMLELPEERSWKASKSTRFSRLPKMCHFCAEKLEAVDRLWRELAEQVKMLRTTIKESKCGGKYKWRGERFEETLKNSDLEVESIRAIMEFLEMGNCSPEKGSTNEIDNENVDSEKKQCSTSEATPTTSSNVDPKDANCPTSSLGQEPSDDSNSKPRRLSRQDSVEIPTRNPTPVPVRQQSSDIYTSHDNDMSVDREEAEEADDELDSEYIKLEPEEVDLTSSNEDAVISDLDDRISALTSKRTALAQSSPFGYANLITSFTCNASSISMTTRNLNQNINQISPPPPMRTSNMEMDATSNNNANQTKEPTPPTHATTSVHNTQFTQNEAMANQLLPNVAHIADPEIIQCSQCSMLFPSWEKLVDHMSKHRDSGLPCDICKDGVKYFIHNLLREHYCTVHGIGEQFPCPLCPAVYFTPQTLKTHIKTRHKNDAIQYPQLRN